MPNGEGIAYGCGHPGGGRNGTPPGWPGGQCCGAGGSGLSGAGGGCALGAAATSCGGAETSACAASTLAMPPPAQRVSALLAKPARLARARRQSGRAAAVRVWKQSGGDRNAPCGLSGRSLYGSCVVRHVNAPPGGTPRGAGRWTAQVGPACSALRQAKARARPCRLRCAHVRSLGLRLRAPPCARRRGCDAARGGMPAPPPWWVRHKRALAAAAAAQACAFLNAVTAVSSESISLQGVDVSTFQARRFPRRIPAHPVRLTLPAAELPELRLAGAGVRRAARARRAPRRRLAVRAVGATAALCAAGGCGRGGQLPHRQGVPVHQHHIRHAA